MRGLGALLAALVLAPAAHAGGPAMTLGAAEDAVRSVTASEAEANMTLLRLAGFRAVRITSIWEPGLVEPTELERGVLENVTAAAALNGVRVYVSVYHKGSLTTPLTPEARSEFADYAAAIVKAFPTVHDVIVGNEPNLNRFWLPQFNGNGTNAAAPAYLQLLATAYDRLKAASPTVTVYGGALAPRGIDRPGTGRPTHSPTKFIRDLGIAYRGSRRRLPIMDAFAFHPYADNSSQPPDFLHPRASTIGIADYGKLVELLGKAFDGTAQPGSDLPILYDEFGVEAVVPPAKSSLYTGYEPATTKPVTPAVQAAYYKRALQIAYCQPNVTGVLFFHSHDEPALGAWQSGVYYADGSPKPSLVAVRRALGATRIGTITRCGITGQPLKPQVSFNSHTYAISLRCNLDCIFQARLVKLPDGSTTAAVSGKAKPWTPTVISLRRKLRAGDYKLMVSLAHPAKRADELLLASSTFTVTG